MAQRVTNIYEWGDGAKVDLIWDDVTGAVTTVRTVNPSLTSGIHVELYRMSDNAIIGQRDVAPNTPQTDTALPGGITLTNDGVKFRQQVFGTRANRT